MAYGLESVFLERESGVRYYSRHFPVIFNKAKGAYLYSVGGKRWLDFLSGAGALNYGHNPDAIKDAILDYIASDGVVSSLDLFSKAKHTFISCFSEAILNGRGLDYKIQFCGPTGTDAVEAALKLARKFTNRKGVVAFSNSYHGMTAGSLSATASSRRAAVEELLPPNWVSFMPFDSFGGMASGEEFLRPMLTRTGCGMAPPAALIVELVQGEGGVNVASKQWIKEVHSLSKELGALFIVDDIQAGCGRTGKFFSFEHFDIEPDLVCVSKSLSGYGFPMSILLMKPEVDVWKPGEHSGTFRGFNYAFVAAAATIEHFWRDSLFAKQIAARAQFLSDRLQMLKETQAQHVVDIRQFGLMVGLELHTSADAEAVRSACFENGLIVETCGPCGSVIKLLPPLTVTEDEIVEGCAVLSEVLERM